MHQQVYESVFMATNEVCVADRVPTKFRQHRVPNTVLEPKTENTVLATLRATLCSLFLRQHSTEQLHSVQHRDSTLHAAPKHGKKCAFGVFLKNTRIGRFAPI